MISLAAEGVRIFYKLFLLGFSLFCKCLKKNKKQKLALRLLSKVNETT